MAKEQLPWGWRDIPGGDGEQNGETSGQTREPLPATYFTPDELTNEGIRELMRQSLDPGLSESEYPTSKILLWRPRDLPGKENPGPQPA